MEGTKSEVGSRARKWTESEARAVIEEWSLSKLSGEQFGRSKGISPQRLSYWKSRLAKKKRAVAFVPVKVVKTGVVASARIEIERDGVVFRVREDLPVEHLARIVAALARGAAGC